MMEGWKEYRLDDIAKVIMGLSPKGDTYNEDGQGMPLLNGPTEFGETHPACTLFTTDPKRICKKGDLIFCVRGSTTGRMNWADKPYALGRGVCSITGVDDLTTKFVKQLLTINLSALLQITGGGTFPNLRKEDINGFKFKIPEHYRKIATILSAYDDLIENNLKRIQLLEEKAQLTYEEWFVRMKFPGHETTAINKETGLPEGWEKKKIGDVIEVGRGSSPRPIADQKYFVDGDIPWLKIADATASNIFIYKTKQYVNEYGASFSRKLPIGSIVVAASGTLGFPMILGVEACIHDGWLYFKGIDDTLKEYFYFSFTGLRKYFEAISYGAAIQNINTGIVRQSPFIIPDENTSIEFKKLASVIFDSINGIQKQNQLLKEARDILLPRLMTGMIDVEQMNIETLQPTTA